MKTGRRRARVQAADKSTDALVKKEESGLPQCLGGLLAPDVAGVLLCEPAARRYWFNHVDQQANGALHDEVALTERLVT